MPGRRDKWTGEDDSYQHLGGDIGDYRGMYEDYSPAGRAGMESFRNSSIANEEKGRPMPKRMGKEQELGRAIGGEIRRKTKQEIKDDKKAGEAATEAYREARRGRTYQDR